MVAQKYSTVLAVDLPGYDSDENSYASYHEDDKVIKTEPETDYQEIEHKQYPSIRVPKTSRLSNFKRSDHDKAIKTEPETDYQELEYKQYPSIQVPKTSLSNVKRSDHENNKAIKTEPEIDYREIEGKQYPPIRVPKTSLPNNKRRYWIASTTGVKSRPILRQTEDEDENLKNKIAALVQQALHDTDMKVKSVKYKEEEEPLYKVGVILSLIKKSRETMNELFNVAVKHRDAWKALEQLKVFELIVHTNVDTTNYVRQLVDLYMQITGTADGGDPRNLFSDLLQYHESRLKNQTLTDQTG